MNWQATKNELKNESVVRFIAIIKKNLFLKRPSKNTYLEVFYYIGLISIKKAYR
jgi:hypothetical protein